LPLNYASSASVSPRATCWTGRPAVATKQLAALEVEARNAEARVLIDEQEIRFVPIHAGNIQRAVAAKHSTWNGAAAIWNMT
jgi:hypothetical protein